MEMGKRVYWINNNRLCWGTVKHLTTKTGTNGKPKQVIVDQDGELRLMDQSYCCSELYDTAEEAFKDGVNRMRKLAAEASEGMIHLIGDLERSRQMEPCNA